MLRANCIFCTALFRRCDYDNTVGYNPNMKFGWEDWDFWLSLLELGGDVYKINETYFYYRVKNNSMIVELKRSQDEIDYLTEMIVKNHPLLYKRYYDFIYERVNSRFFKIFERIISVVKKNSM